MHCDNRYRHTVADVVRIYGAVSAEMQHSSRIETEESVADTVNASTSNGRNLLRLLRSRAAAGDSLYSGVQHACCQNRIDSGDASQGGAAS